MNTPEMLQKKAMVEIRPTVRRSGRPKLVPYADRYKHTGFTSVYGYSTEAAAQIMKAGSTKGLSRFPVFSDVLYVDFDNNDEAAKVFAEYLDDCGYKYQMFHSGGRSIHFHIPIEPMYGINVPYSQKAWMEEHAPEADMSIYRHCGLYRLPGTYHSKNAGKKKIELSAGSGEKLLRIENRPRVSPVRITDEVEEKGEKYFHMILGKLLNTRISAGGRHQHAYKIAMASRTSGKDQEYAMKLLSMWNADNCSPSKPEWELDKIIKWVYGDD